MAEKTEAEVVRDMAANNFGVQKIGDDMLLVVPTGYEIVDIAKILNFGPKYQSGNSNFHDLASFIKFVKARREGALEIFLNETRFVAVLDPSTPGKPGREDYRAQYQMVQSKKLATWLKKNKIAMSQDDFALFIEDNIADIKEPAQATMLEISRTMTASSSMRFERTTRLSNGNVQLGYSETTAARAGELEVPETFAIGIPLFEGGAPYRIVARLRYRLQSGSLSLWYDLHQLDEAVEDYKNLMVAEIQKEFEGVEVFRGQP